ncbi:RDD family protein, partial [Streptomyces iakyrus]
GSVSAEGGNPVGVIVMVVGILAIFLIEVWNLVFRQGNTGQTLGKKWLGISVIRESDGVPLGPVMALLRWIMMAILGGACFLNYLWPLWDSKHQCWHDMVVRSVVVRAR